jgi:hypothetical protein
MRHKFLRIVFIAAICIAAVSVSAPAQTADSFDIITYRVPAGWTKQAKQGAVIYNSTDKAKGTYLLLVLYQSAPSSGDAKGDFDADWKQFVNGQLEIAGEAQLEPARSAAGWQVLTGGAQFEKDLGPSVVLLNTFSGFGTKLSFVALFNSQEYVPLVEAFMSSIELKKSFTPPAPAAAQPAPVSDTSILGTWGQNLGAHMTYGDPVAAGMAGYSKDQYTFNANGTYTFVSKTFRMSYDKIILVIENGTYQISGANLSIRPQKSVIQSWSKLNGGDKFGRMLSSQPRTLEPVTYRFTRHYFSGIDQWQLVLQADKPTERDGPFSTFTLFPNAWYYKPISSNNPVIELPR